MNNALGLHPAAEAALARWHEMVAAGDFGGLAKITHPDVVFRSPIAFQPYISAPAFVVAISNVAQVLTEFSYERQAVTAYGASVALEFSAKVGDKRVKGVDLIRFDEDGKIVEFEVLIRPLNGLQALAEEMRQRVGATLPAFKAKS